MPGAPIVSLELLLDASAEAAIRAEWEALAAAGMSNLAAHTAPSNRPHVTLLVREALPRFDVAAVGAGPGALELGAPVLFGAGDRRVLARSLVPTVELLDFHARVHRAAGPGADLPHSAPGEWVPHVTLARRIRLADLPRAIDLLGSAVPARAAALRRWDSAVAQTTELVVFGD